MNPVFYLQSYKNMCCQVSINYRLSGLGWLSLEEEGVQGNQGLEDMVAALAWVRDNVATFGGDPDQVNVTSIIDTYTYTYTHGCRTAKQF